MTPPLACPVRDCGQPLLRRDRALVCPNGHAHDIARSGYINLLQPQDRRSNAPGDSRDAVQARVRLASAGVGGALIAAFVERAATWLTGAAAPQADGCAGTPATALDRPGGAVIVELGAGAGDLLGALSINAGTGAVSGRHPQVPPHDDAAPGGRTADPSRQQVELVSPAAHLPIVPVGIDLSAPAVETAARRFPLATWVVANADRRWPLLDDSVAVLLSVHARRNPAEAARVLHGHGSLVVAVPAHDDLAELRAALHGEATARDRVELVIAEHAGDFAVVERFSVRDRCTLAPALLQDLLLTTYRGQRRSAAARIESLASLTVTLASDVVVMQRRGSAATAGASPSAR